jgi:hypothetical protein
VTVTKDAWIEEMECGLVEPEERWETLRNCERSLKWHGLYERYLLSAFRGMCSGDVSPTDLKAFFAKANPKRLLVAGDPIPVEGKTINLFRGVSGKDEMRNIRGMSWTDDLNIACHFARKWCNCRNPEVWDWAHDPAVYRMTIPMKDIRCYTDDRGEREYIIDATKLPKLARIEFRDGEMEIRRRVWRYGLDFRCTAP